MAATPDDKLEQLLERHLHDALDGQRGRAKAAFQARLSTASAASSAPAWRWRLRPWLTLAIPLAAAACAVLVWYPLSRVGPVAPPPGAGGGTTAVRVTAPDAAPLLDDVTLTRNLDGGTIVMEDHTPARVLLEQQLRHTQWFDPREKAVISVTQPEQKIRFVALQPY
jgi:hypothetical protein